MYYQWIDWLAWSTFKYDSLLKNIEILISGFEIKKLDNKK